MTGIATNPGTEVATSQKRLASQVSRQHSEEWAKRLHDRDAPIAFPFIRGAGNVPLLARMLRGGRNGEVRLKLFLSLLWISSGDPHDTAYPARAWAELLDLDDPGGRGARRVKDAIDWLAEKGFIRVEERKGYPSRLFLLDEAGTRAEYVHPHAKGLRYIKLRSHFWTKGWISTLSAVATSLYLVLLDQQPYQNGRPAQKGFWLSPNQAKELYALSEDSWTKGIAELEAAGLVVVQRKAVSRDSFGHTRLRNTYRIRARKLAQGPA